MDAQQIAPDVTSGAARRAGASLAWLAVLLIIAVAGAGLILSLDHAPTEEGRPELTARGHALVAPRLEAIDTDLVALANAGDGIAAAGRETLTRLRALEPERVDAALAAGDQAVIDASAALDRMTTARSTLLDGTSATRLPVSDRVQLGTIDVAIAAAGELPGYWQQIGVAASGPAELMGALAAHDTAVVSATDQGRAGQWARALTTLGDAQRLLVPARAVREVAHKAGEDVSTLDDLLDRLDSYDAALVTLYTTLRTANGEMTDGARSALADVDAAQASLPEDQTALVVIVSDLAGPTITPVLLSIESARGALEAALDAMPAAPTGSPPDGRPDALPTDAVPGQSDGVSS